MTSEERLFLGSLRADVFPARTNPFALGKNILDISQADQTFGTFHGLRTWSMTFLAHAPGANPTAAGADMHLKSMPEAVLFSGLGWA